MDSLANSIKAEDSVYDEILMEYKPSIFQNLEKFLRTIRTTKNDINFFLQAYSSNFSTYKILPGINEVCRNNNNLDEMVRAHTSFNRVTIYERSHN